MTIEIPTPLRVYTANQSAVAVDAATVSEAVSALLSRYPEFRKHLLPPTASCAPSSTSTSTTKTSAICPSAKTARFSPPTRSPSSPPSPAGDWPSRRTRLRRRNSAGSSQQRGIAGRAGALRAKTIAVSTCTALSRSRILKEDSWPPPPNPSPCPQLSNDEIARYSRHLILPEVGMEGQQKLKAAKVLCVGTGGLGSPLALYLAAAGIGTLGLVDFDVVDASNLQRQIIHSHQGRRPQQDRLRRRKAHRRSTRSLNVVKHDTMLTSANALEIIKDYDIVADGTDNFPTRYLVNDACVLTGKPNAYGSIFRFEGQASVFATEQGPCYRCLYPEPPPPGLVPSAPKAACSAFCPAWSASSRPLKSSSSSSAKASRSSAACCWSTRSTCASASSSCARIPTAPSAATHPTVTQLIDYQQFCGIVPEAKQAT